MDHLAGDLAFSPVGPVAGSSLGQASTQFQTFSLHHLLPFLAVIVWIIEHWRHTRPGSDADMGQRLFRKLIPEMGGLMIVSALVAMFLVCGREDEALQEDKAWNDVKREWPLLMTADTLIGLQAMVRLVFLLSASFRRPDVKLSSFDGEPAAFFLLAALVRVALLVLSPREVYHLDGPLGGDMNVAMEVTALLLL